MNTPKRHRIASERGGSLVELVMGILMLSVVLLGLAGAAGLAARQTTRGRTDMQLWAAVQTKIDSLVSVGGASVSSGSDAVNGNKLSWTVTGVNPKRVNMYVERTLLSSRATVADTIVFFLTNPS